MTLLLYVALASATADGPLPGDGAIDGAEFAQLTIRQTVVIRIPNAPPPPPRVRWREKKTLKCVPVSNLGGYAITEPDSIDLFVKGGARYRARLERDCPSIAFYSGFYIRPPADGRICVGRDLFHSRSGGQCAISKLRLLVPDR